MRKLYFIIFALMLPASLWAQRTIIADGSWSTPATWAGGNIATSIADDVVMNDNFTVFVPASPAYHVGSFTAGMNNTLQVATGGTLWIGDVSNPRNLIAGINMTISSSGTLIIWGDLIINDNLIMTISGPGQIIIKGNLIIDDLASFSVNGDLEVDGAFTAGHDTHVTVNGDISVYGPTTVGPNSTVVGAGRFHTYGGCSGPPAFCSVAPVQLISFYAEAGLSKVELFWATASELNFDYFVVEKSIDGVHFNEMTTVSGSGNSNARINYSVVDEKPTTGRSYYRLTEVDLDRTINHLKVISVDFSGERSFSIFPNPVVSSAKLKLEMNFTPENTVIVSVVDLRGAKVSEFTMDAQLSEMPVALPSGVYLVTLRSGTFKSVNRLIVN